MFFKILQMPSCFQNSSNAPYHFLFPPFFFSCFLHFLCRFPLLSVCLLLLVPSFLFCFFFNVSFSSFVLVVLFLPLPFMLLLFLLLLLLLLPLPLSFSSPSSSPSSSSSSSSSSVENHRERLLQHLLLREDQLTLLLDLQREAQQGRLVSVVYNSFFLFFLLFFSLFRASVNR